MTTTCFGAAGTAAEAAPGAWALAVESPPNVAQQAAATQSQPVRENFTFALLCDVRKEIPLPADPCVLDFVPAAAIASVAMRLGGIRTSDAFWPASGGEVKISFSGRRFSRLVDLSERRV
jgi:hypothetical protein